MSKQLISKGVSFSDVDEFTKAIKNLVNKESVSHLNFNGNVTKPQEAADGVTDSVAFYINWKEEENI